MPRFAANLSLMFNEWTFLDRFGAAADAGFAAVEYLFPYEFPAQVIAKPLHSRGLTQALFNLPPGDWAGGQRGFAALRKGKDAFKQSVEIARQYADATGVKRLHVMAGIADARDPVAAQTYRDNVAYAADFFAPHGVDVLIEPINGRDMPGYFLNDFEVAERLIVSLARPNLKLQYDVYHRQIMRGDVLKSLEALLPLIGHVQIASVPGRNEPNTGELNDRRICSALDAMAYRGYVGCEYRPKNGTLDGLSWLI